MRRSKFKPIISVMMTVMILFSMFTAQIAFAQPTREATPPPEAPDDAILVEGETGSYGINAGTNTDRAYSGTGFASLGWMDGSSVTYTVTVEKAGTYNFAFNYIAGPVSDWEANRSINIYANGIKTTVTFPGTPSWDDWTYFNQTLELKSGDNTIKVETNGNNNGICIDYFYYWLVEESEELLMPEYPHPNADVYQAEDAQLSGRAFVARDHTGYTGTGFVAGYDYSNNATTTFIVTVPTSGLYYISLRYSAGKVGGWPDDRVVRLSVNGGSPIDVVCKSTDTWNDWAEVINRVELNAGENTIAYSAWTPANDNSDCINLDRLSVWPHSDNPVIDLLAFYPDTYEVSVGGTIQTQLYAVNSNGIRTEVTDPVTYSSADESIATINEAGEVRGVKAGTTTITAQSGTISGTATVKVLPNPTVIVDFASVERPVDPSMFGYILTPNYDVPESRMTLLGPLLNRETIPAQNFQAIGDLDGSYYAYEGSILQRCLEAYNRAKEAGLKWYFLLGHNPSWATASGSPNDANRTKTPEQLARFKQYVKDVLQYFKDNGAEIDFANLTNEGWTGGFDTFKAVWEAVREVYPDPIPTVGPSGVGFRGIPDFYIPLASANQITLEGPCWHEYWTADTFAPLSQLLEWKNVIANLQAQYPEVNGKYIIWEENNSGGVNAGGPTGSAIDFTRSMANVIRAGVSYNIKGCLEGQNWNGMSDLMTTKKSEVKQNPAVRRPLWWVYYAFSKMSGQYVTVTTESLTEEFTAAACKDVNESKIIIAKDSIPGSVGIVLKNQPYSGEDIKIDLYKIVPVENDGLQYQRSITPTPESTDDISFTIDNVGANETWLVIIKKADAPPSFFHPMTPDDGEVALPTPTLTWSEARDAESYTVIVSTNKDLSNPVINKSGITGTSYTIETPLTVGQKYYWSVIAVNEHGSTPVSNNAVYSFIVGNDTDVPGQFGPYLPSQGAVNESVTVEFKWSTAYNATSYRLVVSKNPDLSDPVINQAGITTVRSTGQFGPNSQAYYRPTTPLEYDTTYYWTVYAVNEHGERPMNGPIRYFTTKAEGDAPKSFNLVAPADGAKDVSARTVLEWEPSKNAFFYKLEVSENPDMSDPVIVRDRMIYYRYTVEPNVLKPNTTYYWRVTAYTKDLAYSTPASNGEIRSFTTEAVPCSPLLYAEYGEGDKVKLWFHKSIGATSYKIKYGREPGKYTETISGITESPYEISGLPNGTYYFAVIAENEHGESSIWNERSVTLTESQVEEHSIILNEISDKKPGDTLTISGTSTFDEISIKIIAPNSTVLYFNVVNGPSFSDTITLPADAKVGTYTVVAGRGEIVAITTFRVVSEDTEVPVTGVQLNKDKLSLKVGSTETLIATLIPENATNKNVVWTSSNPDVAEVDSTGKVTAVGVGTAIITVTTEDGNYTATCEVTVKSKDSGVPIIIPIPGPKEEEPGEEPGEGPGEEEGTEVEVKFEDIDDFPWAKEAIETLAKKGIIKGTSETTFEPGRNIIRADFILLLVRLLDLKADFTSNFDDVSPGSYYYEGVGVARALGIAKGIGGNLFDPRAEITREDMMVLAARALRIAGILELDVTFDDIKHFDDADKVSGYAVESVATLVKAGIIKGDGKSLNPKGTATRAEAATMLYRIYQLLNISEK